MPIYKIADLNIEINPKYEKQANSLQLISQMKRRLTFVLRQSKARLTDWLPVAELITLAKAV